MNTRVLSRFGRLTGIAVVTAFALTGCVGVVPMQPAADANNPDCASVIVRLPDLVADQPKRETNAQATGAWGTPAAVLLTCGVTVPGPTTLPCVEINGIDWIQDDAQAPLYRYTTFGRTPAVEVVVDSDVVSGTTALVDLGGAVSYLPQTGQCNDLSDVFTN
jgi:hypothetical protein